LLCPELIGLEWGINKYNLEWPVEVPQIDNNLAHVETKEQYGYVGIRHMGYKLVLK
jgi:hypothetical protein